MDVLRLKDYGQVISESTIGGSIYSDIKNSLANEPSLTVDFEGVLSMATFCSKQIFGALYVEMSPQLFFDKIKIVNASNDMRIVVRLGIEKALADRSSSKAN